MTETPQVPTAPQVHAAIASVIDQLPTIGKDSKITEGPQKYAYRSIEAIKEALKPLLARAQVHYAPTAIIDISDTTYQVGSGSTWQRVRLVVQYRIYGPDGSYVEAVGRGEGADNSDKANNKAMTGAEKQMLLQVFCVADGEDPDSERPPPAVPTWTANQVKGSVVVKIEQGLQVDHPTAQELARKAWSAIGDDTKDAWPIPEAQLLIEACVSEAASIDGMDTAVGGDEK